MVTVAFTNQLMQHLYHGHFFFVRVGLGLPGLLSQSRYRKTISDLFGRRTGYRNLRLFGLITLATRPQSIQDSPFHFRATP